MNLDFLNREVDHRAIDKIHAATIFGCCLSAKPKHILELGVGTGLVTDALLSAIDHNGVGELMCLDSWLDYGGNEPAFWQGFRERGARITVMHERLFLEKTPDDTYDFLMSDADHGGNWCSEHFRVTRKGSICFFHDTNSPDQYPGLYAIEEYARSHGYGYFHFKERTRDDEQTHRGLLMVINNKKG